MIQQLTPRERDVLCRAPMSNLSTGLSLGMSESGVKDVWRRIYVKLDIPDKPPGVKRCVAMFKGLRLGFIDHSEIVDDLWKERAQNESKNIQQTPPTSGQDS